MNKWEKFGLFFMVLGAPYVLGGGLLGGFSVVLVIFGGILFYTSAD